ncbi:hypothetical protein GHT06_013586 [Daphnia sinensis]|uniref:Uncharacterized protein n=1 Tax=Daphnia sinensis TaxID=1820382 RepID=A0AAD5KSE7_9CRUS|nr:hypothetical protein GHT06_013586 [Daphnia sinensis]
MTTISQRLLAVAGHSQCANDVIFVQKQTSAQPASVVVFFGGDIQDYPENMKSHRDHGAYVDYNLEVIAEILAAKFPDSFICVIRPAKIELKTFSCFSNFVICNHIGSPTHLPNNNALLHLSTLLQSIAERTGFSEIGYGSPLVIIGFSKGCVVLNQFLHEFHYFNHLSTDNKSHVSALMGRIKRMIWLDGGHSGGKDTWVTSSQTLSSFLGMDIMVDIHVTPYQINDDRRPWIGKEEKQFYTTLKKMGITLFRKVHFAEEPPSLQNHFLLLKLF